MTKKNTDYRTKGQAVFLAALMVLSMVAVPMAFAGGAAAADLDEDESSLTFDDQAVDSGAVTVEDVEAIDEAGDNTEDAVVVLTYNDGNSVIFAGAEDVPVEGDQPADVTVDIDTDGIPGDYTAHLINESEVTAASPGAGDDITDALEDGDLTPIVQDTASVGSEDFDFFRGANDPRSLFYQGQDVIVTGLEVGSDVQLRSVNTFESNDDVSSSSFEGEFRVGDDGTITIDSSDFDTGDYIIRGNDLAGTSLDEDRDNSFELTEQRFDVDFDEETVRNDGTDTEVEIEFDSNRRTYNVDVSADGLDVEDLTNIFDGAYDVIDDNEADDDDTVTLEDVDGTADVDFSDIETGDYEFEFEVVDTSAEDSASITVEEGGEGELEFDANQYSGVQGDVIEITVDLEDTDEGSVIIGNFDDDGYQANVSVEDGSDDGEVTVLFNTYLAGQDTAGIVSAADDDDVATLENQGESEQAITSSETRMLSTGDYEIITSAETDFEEAADDPDDVATLVIETRDAPDMNLWRTSGDVLDDVADALDDDDVDEIDAIVEAIEDGAVSETDMIAIDEDGSNSDVLIHEISAPGFSGAVDFADQDDATDALHYLLTNDEFQDKNSDNVSELFLEQQNPDRNQDPKEFNVGAEMDAGQFSDIFTVAYDDDAGVFYVALDQDALNNEFEDTFEDGDEFSVEFTLQNERLLRGSGSSFSNADDLEDAYQVAGADFDVEEAEGEFDVTDVDGDDFVTVEADDDQAITGSTNVAPGTEINVRIRSTESSSSFITTNSDIPVSADGTFETMFDFSDQEEGDEFDVSFRRAAFDAEEEGLVIEADVEETETEEETETPEETDEPTETEEPETEEPETEEPETEAPADDDGDDETGDDTPGFGIVVALVALIGAAMLAVRRQN